MLLLEILSQGKYRLKDQGDTDIVQSPKITLSFIFVVIYIHMYMSPASMKINYYVVLFFVFSSSSYFSSSFSSSILLLFVVVFFVVVVVVFVVVVLLLLLLLLLLLFLPYLCISYVRAILMNQDLNYFFYYSYIAILRNVSRG